MSDPAPETDRWLDEGGHEPTLHSHAWFVVEIARASRAELADLWEIAVDQLGRDEASRLWQEALSSSDASET